jgi:putative ABC transport system substrate-binding protein
MRRRHFITLMVLALWPVAAGAQSASMKQIGVLFATDEKNHEQQSRFAAFAQGLTELGWIEGQNIRFEHRWAAGSATRLRAYAKELAMLAPDAILTQGTPATVAMRNVDKRTPIVFVAIADPVRIGVVTSLSHPGGNVTGFAVSEREMGGKWLEMLKQISPSVSRAMVIVNAENHGRMSQARLMEKEGARLGIVVSAAPVRSGVDIESAISAFVTKPNGGLIVLTDFITITHRKLIVAQAARYGLPAVYNSRAFAIIGGLVSYGPSRVDLFRRAASYVDRILKGAKPADLPVQNPIKFDLVINRKTAATLDLNIAPQLLTFADEVIE